MKICETCNKKFVQQTCPLPTYHCSCKGNYCRLLGRDPCKDMQCQSCIENKQKAAQS